jgi:protein-L-isoaspartate(D-aspartate) O-methyltransferase
MDPLNPAPKKSRELPPLPEPPKPFVGQEQMGILRERMVETQLKARGIIDKAVLDLLGRLPRHLFVDPSMVDLAYSDGPLPIGFGQTISQPYIVAFMTETLALTPEDRVLEIGSGCGYQTAVLASLAQEVYAVELLPGLFDQGRANIKKLGFQNVWAKHGDGSLGWPEMAPFTAIVAAAYGSRTPRRLLDQLSPGGRLLMPLGEPESQSLVLFRKAKDGRVTSRSILGCRFVPLVGG